MSALEKIALVSFVAPLALASLLSRAESVEVIPDPSPIPYVKPGALVTVLFDGKPAMGAKVQVWRHYSADSYVLDTDDAGRAKLPDLPAGSYSVSASLGGNTAAVHIVDVCATACRENMFELTELAFDSLHGPIYAIDRSALGMSQISIDIAPDKTPGFKDVIVRAEQEPAAFTLRAFRGVVIDQTGAVIPGASVSVVSKRGEEIQLVSALATDSDGGFAARLDGGDYYVVIAAQGFCSQALHVVIAPQGSPERAEITLKVGAVT